MVMMAVADRDRQGRVDRSIDISHEPQWLPRHFGLAANAAHKRGAADAFWSQTWSHRIFGFKNCNKYQLVMPLRGRLKSVGGLNYAANVWGISQEWSGIILASFPEEQSYDALPYQVILCEHLTATAYPASSPSSRKAFTSCA
jgi:hypothetical protein